ncbi:hypothetical protein HYX07_03275 [Candidatus Woesearchaeota archaeon]|nr:hypothetical protein [Candidatus Woesearchaeota archaeon]
MDSDIVLPKNNETEFIEIASNLGIKKLYFLYDFDSYDGERTAKKLESITKHLNIPIDIGFLVNERNLIKAAKQSKMLVAKSSSNDRAVIESGKVKIIYGFEEFHKRDHLHQRASGLNHILCELASKNKVAIGFSYSMLLSKNPETASMLMGRMMQNIILCQKYNPRMVIASFSEKPYDLRAPHDTMSLLAMLGTSKNTKYSLLSHL